MKSIAKNLSDVTPSTNQESALEHNISRRKTMKHLRWLLVLAVLALVLSVGAFSASAAGSDPTGAPYVENGVHSIGANTSTWYRFEYPGDHSQMTVQLIDAIHDGVDHGLAFQVYAPSQMQEWWNHDGIGAGNPKGNDLIWTGNAHESGTWWIKVANTNPSETQFNLAVAGDKVTFVEPSQPTNAVTEPSITAPENADPNRALVVEPSWQVIPANSTLWYRFPYGGTRDQAILTIPDGGKNLLRVHVHTPEQMKSWWNATPVGQATPKDDDLVWSGNADEAGWWYVEVVNDNPTPVDFQLLLQQIDRNLR